MSELIFYTNPQSRGRMVRRMLEECGARYRTEVLAYGEEMKNAAYSRINPMGKVPALVYEGKVVTEAAAIITFLAEVFPQAQLAPPPDQRQAYYRWLFFTAGPLEASLTDRILGVTVTEDKQRFVGYGTSEQAVNTLIQAIEANPWIAGETFSAADVYVGSQVAYGLQFGMLPQHQVLLEYRDRLSARPAWQRAEELDNALLAAG